MVEETTCSGASFGEIGGEISVVAEAHGCDARRFVGRCGPTGVAVAAGKRMVTDLTNERHTFVNREYVVVDLNGHGNGACKDNHGVEYKMMF